jgi:hypothetical protein
MLKTLNIGTTGSKSTDKLEIIASLLEQKILYDADLKSKVSKISIIWKTKGIVDRSVVVVPELVVEFRA